MIRGDRGSDAQAECSALSTGETMPAARGAGPPASGRLLETAPRQRPGRCPGLQPQMREDPRDHRCLQDGGNDLELTTAVRAVVDVDLKHALEQPGPADARWPAVRASPNSTARATPSARCCTAPWSLIWRPGLRCLAPASSMARVAPHTTALCGAGVSQIPGVRSLCQRYCAGAVRELRARLLGRLCLQGPQCVPLVQHAAHGPGFGTSMQLGHPIPDTCDRLLALHKTYTDTKIWLHR